MSVTLANLSMAVCHCSMCRKSTGGTGFSFFYSHTCPIFKQSNTLKIFNSIGVTERAFRNNCGSTIYYHRLSNEYHNGLLREYHLKPINFRMVPQRTITESLNSINTRPRKTLKWRSAQLNFEKECSKLR